MTIYHFNNKPKAEKPEPDRPEIKCGTHDRIVVACVYRTGPGYNWDYIYNLYRAVTRHLHIPFDFVCLTNSIKTKGHAKAEHIGIKVLKLNQNWPGWWSKLELFRPFLFDRILYFDLNTLITGNITELAMYGGDFAMLSNFAHLERCNSGVMAWRPAATWDIYKAFKKDPDRIMQSLRTKGDQLFIEREAARPIDRLQEFVPGQIASWKLGRITDNTRVICFHGDPRPHTLRDDPIIQRHWLGENNG